MSDWLVDLFGRLPPFIQGAGAVVIMLVIGPLIMRRARQELAKMGNPGEPGQDDRMTKNMPPHYLLISPVSDVFGAVHDLAEQGRITNELLRRLIEVQGACVSQLRVQNQLLEFIRNNQEMRSDPQPPPNPRNVLRGP